MKTSKCQMPGTFSFEDLRIQYTNLVNIMSLSGTHQKREPLHPKGLKKFSFSLLCNFLYIVDRIGILLSKLMKTMYKKPTFYAYVCTEKYSLYVKNMLYFTCGAIHSSTSRNDKKQPLSNAMGYEVAFI